MIIADSRLELHAQAHSFSQIEKQQSLRMWKTEPPPLAENEGSTFAAHRPALQSAQTSGGMGNQGPSTPYSLAAMILERFFGLKITVITPDDMAQGGGEPPTDASQANQTASNRQGWGMEITSQTRTIDEQSLSFSASGKVTTADGRELSFSFDMEMSRRRVVEESTTLRLGDAPIDPLVLQLQPGSLELSDQTFAFDLNGDGQQENVPVLQSGSFFLVRDQNGDGQVQDGKELMGPTSGSGFAELADLDTDGNRWVDEGDAAFFNLRLWQPDSEGKGTLVSLLDAGVGALSVDAINTPWQMDRGNLRESGVFLSQTGQPGLMGEMLFKTGAVDA